MGWWSVLQDLWKKNMYICNRCLCSGFVIIANTSGTKWETWLQKEEYRQKHPNHFLLYSAFLNIIYTHFRLRASAVMLQAGVRKGRQEHIASFLWCEYSAWALPSGITNACTELAVPGRAAFVPSLFSSTHVHWPCITGSNPDNELDATRTSYPMKDLNSERCTTLILCDTPGSLDSFLSPTRKIKGVTLIFHFFLFSFFFFHLCKSNFQWQYYFTFSVLFIFNEKKKSYFTSIFTKQRPLCPSIQTYIKWQ